MKHLGGLSYCLTLIGGLALAGCAGSGGGAPANSPVAPTLAQAATLAPGSSAYPVGTPAVVVPAYPAGTPASEALPAVLPYPIATEGAPAAQGKSADAALIELAKKDLAKQLSVAADQISVVSSVSTDWPDSSLGCPKPGVAYAQVITPGYRILLALAQKQYDYHTNLTDQLVLCAP